MQVKSLACLLYLCNISNNSLNKCLFVAENVDKKLSQISLFHAIMPLKILPNKDKTLAHF